MNLMERGLRLYVGVIRVFFKLNKKNNQNNNELQPIKKMKRVTLFLAICLSLSIKAQDIQRLFENRDFISLYNLGVGDWESDDFSSSLIKASTFHAMFRPEKSNREIEFLLTTSEAKESPGWRIHLLIWQADNYVRTFQYRRAAEIYEKILINYGDLLGEGKWSFQNIVQKYYALSDVKPLQVNIPHDNIQIQMTPDKKGLPQVSVRTPKDSVSLIFDTGAGVSSVTRSVADRLGIRVLADSIIIGGSTGNFEYMSIGVADTLFLGNVLFTNVVFGIFEDEKFTFPEYDYMVNGTLGFPEIKALSSMKIHRNDVLEVVKNTEYQHRSNMMLTENREIFVQVNDSLLFFLDTGAVWSSLSVNYYNEHREHIEKTGEFTTRVVGGMGGSREFPVYRLTDFPIQIGENSVILPTISVFIQAIFQRHEFDGVLGQDVISQFDYMLLDFRNMHFSLGNTNN